MFISPIVYFRLCMYTDCILQRKALKCVNISYFKHILNHVLLNLILHYVYFTRQLFGILNTSNIYKYGICLHHFSMPKVLTLTF